MKLVRFAAVVVAATLSAAALTAHGQVIVGGAPMYSSRNIVDNAARSGDHAILVAGLKAAGLADTLQGKGPFTVFAPVDAAFEALPGRRDGQPAQKGRTRRSCARCSRITS